MLFLLIGITTVKNVFQWDLPCTQAISSYFFGISSKTALIMIIIQHIKQ